MLTLESTSPHEWTLYSNVDAVMLLQSPLLGNAHSGEALIQAAGAAPGIGSVAVMQNECLQSAKFLLC